MIWISPLKSLPVINLRMKKDPSYNTLSRNFRILGIKIRAQELSKQAGHTLSIKVQNYKWLLITSDGKESSVMPETWVQSLGGEDSLEKGMANHSGILAWEIPWTEEPGALHTVHGIAESDTADTSLSQQFQWKLKEGFSGGSAIKNPPAT